MKKIFLAFAHPDDESFAAPRTVKRYTTAGWQIHRFFATDSDYKEGKLSTLTPGTLEDPIFRQMDLELPDIVITFDKTGINNDPDHIKMCYAVTYAFQKYVAWLEGLQKKFRVRMGKHDEVWFKRLEMMVRTKTEPKLYYACVPRSSIMRAVASGQLTKDSFDVPWRGVQDDQITTIIDEECFLLRMEGKKEYFMGKKDRIRDSL